MLVLLHVLVAVFSLFFSAYLVVFPSVRKIHWLYGLIAGTLISGTALIFAQPSHMKSICISGLTYLGVTSLCAVIAHRRLPESN